MGRSRGGLTSKIHTVVDTNRLPVRLGLTAGEAHDNRLALSFFISPEIGINAAGVIVDMTQTGLEPLPPKERRTGQRDPSGVEGK